MPLEFKIKRKFAQKSGRVNSVDLHPTEPWILTALNSGSVCIWDYQSQTMTKSFEVTKLPVRSAKFVARKQWVVAGADDKFIRVYNYNTMDKVKEYEAHTDSIRCVAVHPTLPYILSASDDELIKLWDWEKSWYCTQIYIGHNYIVMQVTINPKDTNTFASASTDGTVKVWNLGSPYPNFTIYDGYGSLNCVDYITLGDKSYLISGSNYIIAKVWDYETKTCVQNLEGHAQHVTSVCFHPELPIIITGYKDGTVCIWHATTYRLENTLNYGFGAVWAVGYMKGLRMIAIGYDEGTIMVKFGRETPVASMDNSGKIVWAKHNEMQTVNIKSVGDDYEVSDGERLPLAVKELGTCDLYPQSMKHDPDGMFVTVCGDGEYIIYTALAWRKRSFGSALEIVWSSDGEYAIRESTTKIKIFNKYFQEKKSVDPKFSTERIYGGSLLAMCSNDFICFYDWAECRLIHRIDVKVKKLYWSKSGDMLAIASDSSFYILRYSNDVVLAHLESERSVDQKGIEDSFKLVNEVSERVRTGLWVGDRFVYTNSSWRLNYCVGGVSTTMYHLDRPMYLLGYLANQSIVYLIDKEFNFIAYTLSGLVRRLYSVLGDAEKIEKLIPLAKESGENNVAFSCLFMLGRLDECLQLLVDSNRIPQAALMARAYFPSKVSEIVALWRKDLNKVTQKAADPKEYPNRYEDWQVALEVEARAAETRGSYPVAEEYVNYGGRSHVSLVEVFKNMQLDHDGIRQPRASTADRSDSRHRGGKSQYPQSKEGDAQGVEDYRKEGEFIDGQKSSPITIEKTYVHGTEIVYSLDLHPTKPWVLLGLWGEVRIWNCQSRIKWRSFDVKHEPVRPIKFIVRNDWIVFGANDRFICAYNYNTMESITKFKAHTDWIRSVVVHPSLPYILSASDDNLIKLWDWNNGWECVRTFQGHRHRVMQLGFSPRDTNIFTSVSWDGTIKTWNLGSSSPHLSIKCNQGILNCLDFFDTDEKLYLVTGSGDHTAKVWDYETGTCVITLEGHTDKVTSVVCVNSYINFIITGSEDEIIRVWNATTYELEHEFTPELGKVKTISFVKDSSQVIVGCDDGIFVGQIIPARS